MNNRTSASSAARSKFIAVVVVTVLLVVGSIVYVAWARAHRSAPDYEGSGTAQVQLVEIKPGSSVSALGPELVRLGVVKSNGAFQTAAATNSKASTITPGFYRLHSHMSAASAVSALLDPKNKVKLLRVANGATLNDVKVVGGSVRPGIYSLIAASTCGAKPAGNCVTVAKLAHAAAFTDPASLGVPSWAVKYVAQRGHDPRRIEGLIKPGDYVINPKLNAEQILHQLLETSSKAYEAAGLITAAKNTKLDPYKLLVAASLVERESPKGQFGKVARVIVNRLNKPMKLEFDSTVNYGLPTQEVATRDEDRKAPTPWNTYAKMGLPDTPIASPSAEAISAVEHPTPGNWLFFVTTDKDGTTEFSDSMDDHMKKIQKSRDNGVLDSKRTAGK